MTPNSPPFNLATKEGPSAAALSQTRIDETPVQDDSHSSWSHLMTTCRLIHHPGHQRLLSRRGGGADTPVRIIDWKVARQGTKGRPAIVGGVV